jgi:hypothetical protein
MRSLVFGLSLLGLASSQSVKKLSPGGYSASNPLAIASAGDKHFYVADAGKIVKVTGRDGQAATLIAGALI